MNALANARFLRQKATSIDGWCAACYQIDKHLDWCPWTMLLEGIEAMQAFILNGPHHDLSREQLALYDKARRAAL